jgi:hypothetical protein
VAVAMGNFWPEPWPAREPEVALQLIDLAAREALAAKKPTPESPPRGGESVFHERVLNRIAFPPSRSGKGGQGG